MLIIGCDFHTRYQQIAMLDTLTGELTERRLDHESGEAHASTAACKARCAWASKPPVRCIGSRAGGRLGHRPSHRRGCRTMRFSGCGF